MQSQVVYFLTESVAAGGGELDFQLVVHIPGVRNPVGDFADETFFPGTVHRPAQDDPAIDGGDLHVSGICGQFVVRDDFPANLPLGVRINLAIARVQCDQRAVIAIPTTGTGVVSLGRCGGAEPGLNVIGAINPAGITGLAESQAIRRL